MGGLGKNKTLWSTVGSSFEEHLTFKMVAAENIAVIKTSF